LNGSVIAIPHVLFKNLSKIDAEYFKDNANQVIEKKKSLKKLADDYNKAVLRKMTEKAILEISGCNSMKDLQEVYPGRFSDEVMDGFEGAVTGKKPNDVGDALQDYFKSVCEGETEENAAKVLFKESSLDDGGFDFWSGHGRHHHSNQVGRA